MGRISYDGLLDYMEEDILPELEASLDEEILYKNNRFLEQLDSYLRPVLIERMKEFSDDKPFTTVYQGDYNKLTELRINPIPTNSIQERFSIDGGNRMPALLEILLRWFKFSFEITPGADRKRWILKKQNEIIEIINAHL